MLNERNTLLEDDGIEEEILVEEECSVAQAVWGDIQGNIENQTDLQNALDAKQDSLTEAQLNAVNSGITAGKVTTYDGYADQIASKADQSALNAEATTRGEADTALGTRIDNEALARQSADNGLQTQIDAITSKSDVVDVVANYAALQAYDTSTLGNNDVVKVLDDETHEDALTYYRWSTTTQTWSYIGQEAPYYSKGQMDTKLAEKQDKLTAGANIQIQNGTISATDTTYTAGNGLNLNGTEFSADTDILATKEDLEGYYTKPETDNLLAPKLEAEVVAELPTTGAEGKLYLTPKAHTTQTATGNPITATVTEQAGAIESFQLDGDTFQQSYEGKNLLDFPNGSFTSNGVTSVWENGKVTISGTATSNQVFVTNYLTNTLAAGTYTFSMGGVEAPHRFIFRTFDANNQTIASYILEQGNTSAEVTIAGTEAKYRIVMLAQAETTYDETDYFQLESGSTATSFEPYVGGVPSPSPEYPQAIQTVTGRQVVNVTGKNLFDSSKIIIGDIQNANPTIRLRSSQVLWLEAGTYTFSTNLPTPLRYSISTTDVGYPPYASWPTWDYNSSWQSSARKTTFTLTKGGYFNVQLSKPNNDTLTLDEFSGYHYQLEAGSTATDYEPYSSNDYEIDLGDIELNNLGDVYLDYIWEDMGEWKIHKATKKMALSDVTDWGGYAQGSLQVHYFVDLQSAGGSSDSNPILTNGFRPKFLIEENTCFLGGSNNRVCFCSLTTLNWNDYIADKNPVVHYGIANPTDTVITNQNLIAQLEAIRTALLQNGANTITNTATGDNLAGDMEIGYYGFNPRNRYDKWLWLDINNEYEQIGS